MGYHKPMKDEGKVVDEPLKKDVLFGRSSRALKHSGNVTFRNIIAMKADEYNSALSRPHKTLIVVGIVDMVTMQGGRFLKEDAASRRWVVVDRSTALNKTGHCMRDKVMKMQKSGEAKRAIKKSKEAEDRTYPGMSVPEANQLNSTSSQGLVKGDESTKAATPSPRMQHNHLGAAGASHQQSFHFPTRSSTAASVRHLPYAQALAAAGLSSNVFAGLNAPFTGPSASLFLGHHHPVTSALNRGPINTSYPLQLATPYEEAISEATGVAEALGTRGLGSRENFALERLERSKKELIEATKLVEAQKARLLMVLQGGQPRPQSVTSIEIDTGL